MSLPIYTHCHKNVATLKICKFRAYFQAILSRLKHIQWYSVYTRKVKCATLYTQITTHGCTCKMRYFGFPMVKQAHCRNFIVPLSSKSIIQEKVVFCFLGIAIMGCLNDVQ